MKQIVEKINDLLTIRDGYPQGSRGWEALDWAIKNLAIAHDSMVLSGKKVKAEDMNWEDHL